MFTRIDKHYTYIHCKPDGTPFYVGKGYGRRGFRVNSLRNEFHNRVVKKYGEENILVYVFVCESSEQAFSDEKQQIAQLRQEGYVLANMTAGGDGGFLGCKHTEETKKKLSLIHKGHPVSGETRAKISAAMKGKRLGHKDLVGRVHTDDAKRKMSLAGKGRKKSEEHRIKLSLAAKRRHERERNEKNITFSYTERTF